MNFRKKLNSIKEIKDNQFFNKDKYAPEYILDVIIAYLSYLACADGISGKIELVLSVENTLTNILEVIVKSQADNYTGTVVYYKYFPKRNGAMQTINKLQQIFEKEQFEIKRYDNNPRYTKYYEKRFSIFIEFK